MSIHNPALIFNNYKQFALLSIIYHLLIYISILSIYLYMYVSTIYLRHLCVYITVCMYVCMYLPTYFSMYMYLYIYIGI